MLCGRPDDSLSWKPHWLECDCRLSIAIIFIMVWIAQIISCVLFSSWHFLVSSSLCVSFLVCLLLTSVVIRYVVKSLTQGILTCRTVTCEQGLKEALHTKATRKFSVIETMLPLSVRTTSTGVPNSNRLVFNRMPAAIITSEQLGHVCVCKLF